MTRCASPPAHHPLVPGGFTHSASEHICFARKLIQCKLLRFENDRPGFSMGFSFFEREEMLHVE